MSIIHPVVSPIAKTIKWFSDTKIAKNAGENVYKNNRKYIDLLGVGSIVAKDGLGCYLYVTQSMNNKDIPEEKRNFVAALDLTNGVLMIALQLLMFFTVSHKVCQTKMFDKFFSKFFDRPIRKAYQSLVQHQQGFSDINGYKFNKEFGKIRENVKDAFGGLTSLAAATIVGKRMLVPFIATPLADKVEQKLGSKMNKTQDKNSEPIATEDKSTPTMKGSIKEDNIVDNAPTFDTGSTNLLTKYKK